MQLFEYFQSDVIFDCKNISSLHELIARFLYVYEVVLLSNVVMVIFATMMWL